MRARSRRRRGLTLVELLVTAAILGVTAPTILLASGTASRLGRSAQKRACAVGIATHTLESFRAAVRANSANSGSGVVTYSVNSVGTFTATTVVTLSGEFATCETTVRWSETRGKGVFTDSLQLGTAMRLGT